mgnify:CR=1 FL=1
MSLEENIARVKENIARAAREAGRDPGEVALVAATKVQTSDTIRAAIGARGGMCGENRVQELTGHLEDGAYEGARVHFIGHLQTNKVKYVVGRVDLIESVGSLRLLEAVDRQAAKVGVVQDILLEVNIGREESKGGCLPEDLPDLARRAVEAQHVRLRGLMCIPPAAGAPGANVGYFQATRQFFVDIREKIGDNDTDIDCLSMGMSGDYEDAVREGATLVRVGTALFGPRPPLRP